MLIDNLTLIKLLEKADFSQVYLYENQATNEKYALKKIEKGKEKESEMKKYIDNEIKILKDIDHPNLLKLYKVKETPEYYFILTDYYNGLKLSENLETYYE